MTNINMNNKLKEILIIILAATILGISTGLNNNSIIPQTIISFFIIISINTLAKKTTAYYYQANIKIKFWSLYQYGFQKGSHFKKPVPMFWITPVLAILSKVNFLWMAILSFEIKPSPERAAKRHELYRFSEIAEWHVSLIVLSGILANLLLAIIGYILSFETFAQLNILFAAWSLLPLGQLDGAKLFFGSKKLWTTTLIVIVIFIAYSAQFI